LREVFVRVHRRYGEIHDESFFFLLSEITGKFQYLIGVDFSFSVPKQQVQEQSYGGVIEGKGEINHFHPDYRKPGEKWTVPRLDIQEQAFRCARETFEAGGGRILNASRQTALEVFPKTNFDDVVASPAA